MRSFFFFVLVSLPPAALTVEATNTSMNATWLPPSDANGVIAFYRTSIALNSSLVEVNTSVEVLTVVFDDLKPFTNYTVAVRAVTDGGRIMGDVVVENVTTLVGGTHTHTHIKAAFKGGAKSGIFVPPPPPPPPPLR